MNEETSASKGSLDEQRKWFEGDKSTSTSIFTSTSSGESWSLFIGLSG